MKGSFCMCVLLLCALKDVRFAAAAACYNKLSRDNFTNCQVVGPRYALHWTINDTVLTLGLEVDGQPGWIGFGLSEAGGMAGADIVTVEQLSYDSHDWTVIDRRAAAFAEPQGDRQQDYRLTSDVLQDASSTAVVLQRRLTTCDDNDLTVNPGVKQNVIWAYGDSWGYHGPQNRGSSIVTFGTPPAGLQSEGTANATGLLSFSVSMPNVEVPGNDTSYFCLNFPVPADQRYHAIEFYTTPAINYVHHTVVYACTGKPKNHTDGKAFECLTQEGRDLQCQSFYAVWAPGVMPFRAPHVAGYPFGKGEHQWFTLEVHYTNPELVTDAIDNTTFTMKYTPNLRQYDIGILTLGTFNLTIPPGQRNVSFSNLCPSSCTQTFDHNITLLHSFYHMHGLGKALVTQHLSQARELRPLGRRTAYSYNYQDPVAIPTDTAILSPGDALITTCTYDSRSRFNVTEFGPRTQDEMCFNFVAYYPRIRGGLDMWCIENPIAGMDSSALCADGTSLARLREASESEDKAAEARLLAELRTDGKLVTSGALEAHTPFKEPTCRAP